MKTHITFHMLFVSSCRTNAAIQCVGSDWPMLLIISLNQVSGFFEISDLLRGLQGQSKPPGFLIKFHMTKSQMYLSHFGTTGRQREGAV
jgi:hypothetical protein